MRPADNQELQLPHLGCLQVAEFEKFAESMRKILPEEEEEFCWRAALPVKSLFASARNMQCP